MFQQRVSINVKLLLVLLAPCLLSTATAAQNNNCCFVDRQCTTNEDWTAGYYAFRNGQCAAPAESQQQAHQARQDQTPSQSNNCCFSGWQCSSDEDWVSGYWAFRYDQCDPPARAESPDQAPRPADDEQKQWQAQGKALWKEGVKLPLNRWRRWDKYKGTIVYSQSNTQTQQLSDGTKIFSVTITHPQMCAIHPGLDWCQYPENYPHVWQRYPDIWQEIQDQISDE